MNRTRLLAGVGACAGALLAATSSAEAACYSSTPSSVTLADSPFDGDFGLAPEITTVTAAVDSACNYAVNPGLLPLITGDYVFVYIDRDGNAATGSAVFDGADAVVGTAGGTYGDAPPLLGLWNGTQFTFASTTPVGSAPFDGGFSATLDALGIQPGVTTGLIVGAHYDGLYDNYYDFAPEAGMAPIALPVNYSTAAPPPPPPPAPTPVPTPIATPVPLPSEPADVEEEGCTVPSVKGRTRAAAESRLFNADCEVAFSVVKRYSNSVRKGRIIGTSPGTGTLTSRRVKLIVSKGRKRARARASAVSPALLERLERLANAPVK